MNYKLSNTPRKKPLIFVLAIILFTIGSLGCASKPYRNTMEGKFYGAVDVRWLMNDYFVFIPNKDKPLQFKRASGEVIKPGVMYTDGGSVPRFLWGIKGYSPWGYAPAYLIHDWLYEAQHCNYKPDNKYNFNESIDILQESLKAIMETNIEVRDYFVFDTISAAVASPIAKRLWEKGLCKAPDTDNKSGNNILNLDHEPGDLLMTISFE